MCEHDYNWSDRPDDEPDDEPDCTIHVDCDEQCMALTDPQSEDELRAAYEHWRFHGYLYGCSHGH